MAGIASWTSYKALRDKLIRDGKLVESEQPWRTGPPLPDIDDDAFAKALTTAPARQPVDQADDQRGDHHQKEVAQHPILDRLPPHGLDKLPFSDFLALRELFKLSRKLNQLFVDFDVVN
jgi:hypothetical protein